MTVVAKPKLADPGALIRDGKLRTGTFPACMDPDLIVEHAQLLEQREELAEQRASQQASASDSLAAKASTPDLDGQIADLDKQVAALEKQIQGATVVLTLRALPRNEFRAMFDRHPPRKDDEGKLTHGQDVIGASFEAFFDDLLRASIVDPKLDAETLDLLLDERLTDRDWERLTDVAWGLNRAVVSVPFLSAVSPSRRNSSPR